jgi:hypothetical protein
MLNGVTLAEVKKMRARFKDIYQLNDHSTGVYFNVREKLRTILSLIHKNLSENEILVDDFKLKFCVDGTNVGNHKTYLNINFSVINEGAKCKTASGHYILGIFSIDKEDYKTMNECLSIIFDELNTINDIQIENQSIKIEKFLGGDLKALLTMAGINPAISTFGCLWCTCSKDLYFDHSQEWSIIDQNKGARSHEEAKTIIEKNLKTPKEKKGYVFKAISHCFPFFRYIIDMLHLKLRITEKLNEYFFDHLDESSNNERDYNDPNDINIKNPLVGKLNDFLVNVCKILRPIVVTVNLNNPLNNQYKLRDFKGGEQTRFYEKITEKNEMNMEANSIDKMFPQLKKGSNIHALYKSFFDIYISVKKKQIESSEIKKRSSHWLQLYVETYGRGKVTPYMHAFAHHLHEFQSLYDDINSFNQEGHEKFNDLETKNYFNATNRSNKSINQLIHKFNRCELMSLGLII